MSYRRRQWRLCVKMTTWRPMSHFFQGRNLLCGLRCLGLRPWWVCVPVILTPTTLEVLFVKHSPFVQDLNWSFRKDRYDPSSVGGRSSRRTRTTVVTKVTLLIDPGSCRLRRATNGHVDVLSVTSPNSWSRWRHPKTC